MPLASFVLIVFWGPRMGRGGHCAGYLATGAIIGSAVALRPWRSGCGMIPRVARPGRHADVGERAQATRSPTRRLIPSSGDWYTAGASSARCSSRIGYYIDALTVAMFCMVTLVATCIHVYSFGYMHEELHEVTDPLVTLADGQPLRRRGRFHRFYQYLSLFCFSMLGLVIAGNLAMVFVFWELVGICSYLLDRLLHRAPAAPRNAANKAFIVNRVGDFGMIVGLMAIWTGLGTFSFGDYGTTPAVSTSRASSARSGRPRRPRPPVVPDGMVDVCRAEDRNRATSCRARRDAEPAGCRSAAWSQGHRAS